MIMSIWLYDLIRFDSIHPLPSNACLIPLRLLFAYFYAYLFVEITIDQESRDEPLGRFCRLE